MKRFDAALPMTEYTVALLGPDELSVRLYHVQSHDPRQAYRDAVKEAELALLNKDDEYEPELNMGLGRALKEWPLLFVTEGRFVLTPVLTGSQLVETWQ